MYDSRIVGWQLVAGECLVGRSSLNSLQSIESYQSFLYLWY